MMKKIKPAAGAAFVLGALLVSALLAAGFESSAPTGERLALAQEATGEASDAAPEPDIDDPLQVEVSEQASAPVRVTRSEPDEITEGTAVTLTVFGENFTSSSRVRLVGFGLLTTTFVNQTALTAEVPSNVPRGDYDVEVVDLLNGTGRSPQQLDINAPDAPDPTERPDPTPTDAPTPIPGQPSLVVRNFNANPPQIVPGGATTFTFEVLNQGSREALGVSVSVDTGGKFIPAVGQSAVTLPNLPPGGLVTAQLSVVAAEDTTPGINSIPITFNYFDFSGTAQSSKAALSVLVLEVVRASQIILARYQLDPNPVIPGNTVFVSLLFQNTGSDIARQVSVRLGGDDSVLLPGPQGDTFPLGDIPAGGSVSLDVPMIVNASARSGPQGQPIGVRFLQGAEAAEASASMTIPVASVILPKPLLLLEAYDVGAPTLKPGDEFTLTMALRNAGEADASGLLVTFGTVESSGDDGGGTDTTGGTQTPGSSTTTTPSSTFAPLGGGGTLLVGDLPAGAGTTTVSQRFIVNGSVESGVYSLPITLRYETPEGRAAQDSLRASLVVLAPPRFAVNVESPLPPEVFVGDQVTLGVNVRNNGSDSVEVLNAAFSADAAEVVEGALTPLEPLGTDEDVSITGVVVPFEPGTLTVTLAISYINALNQPDVLTLDYETTVIDAPPMPTFDPNVTFEPPPTPPPTPEPDRLGQLLRGLLGLGS